MANSKSFSNKEIAELLEKVSASYEILNKDRFRISAYERASVSVMHATSEVKDMWDDGKLDEIPGIGKSIGAYLDELFRTGRVKHFEFIFNKISPSIFVFLKIPGVGPKTASVLAESLDIKEGKNALIKLKNAALDGKIRTIENFGEKSEKDILHGIEKALRGEGKETRMLFYQAEEQAVQIIKYLKKSKYVLEADPLGSLRRKLATVGDIDIAVSTKNPALVIKYFLQFDKIKEVISQGEKTLVRVVLYSTHQVDVRFSDPAKYGSMLQYFTGSKQHNIKLREYALKKGLSLSEYGIKNLKTSKITFFKDEPSFYHYLKLDYIPPELREDQGEIQAAKGGLPSLVELGDIKGDLHLHSNFNIEPSHDLGESSLVEMLVQAKKLNYQYIGFSEHNPSKSQHSKQQIIDLLKRKNEFIEQGYYSFINKYHDRVNILPKKVFNGLEIDINPSGELNIDEKAIETLDYAIGSIHSSFDLSREKMTKRVLKCLSHPKLKIFGHPTGRMLPDREGYELDWDQIFDFCLKNKKILEINSWPNRLDLTDTKVRQAIKYGVKLIINSDSHNANQMPFLRYGVDAARRGWAEKGNIVNCLDLTPFSNLINS